MVVVTSVRIFVDSIVGIVLREGGIVSSGIPLRSRVLRCLQQRLLVCRLETLIAECLGFR